MVDRGLSAYIITGSDAHQSEYIADYWRVREWLSGFTGSSGIVVVTRSDAGLWTDGRYFIQAEQELTGTGISLFKMNEPGVPTYRRWLADNLGPNDTVGFDGKVFSVSDFEAIKKELSSAGVSYRYDSDIAGELWEGRPAMPIAPAFVHDIRFAGRTSSEKLSDVRAEMKKKQADAYLVAALDDIAWLANIRGKDVANMPVVYAYMLITMTDAYLFIDGCKLDYLPDFILRPYEDVFDCVSTSNKSLLYDPVSTSVAIFDAIPKTVKTIKSPSVIAGLKSAKNEIEIKNCRNAFLKEGVVMVRFLKWLEAKKIEGDLPDETVIQEKLSQLRSAEEYCLGDSFTTIAAYGENAALAHYSPKPGKCAQLRPEGFLLVDTGGQYLDGTTDLTRTIVMGPVTDEMRRDFTLVLKGHFALARAKFLKGTCGVHLDVLARQYIWEAGMDYKHGTGHGLGFCLGVHEGPQNISMRINNHGLRPGMLCSNEPGIYKEGRHGIRTENIMLVKLLEENEFGTFLGFETMSYCPIDTRALDKSLLTSDELDYLNDYHKLVYEKLSPRLTQEEGAWLKEFGAAIY